MRENLRIIAIFLIGISVGISVTLLVLDGQRAYRRYHHNPEAAKPDATKIEPTPGPEIEEP